jgi:hypothetical protein
MTLQSPCCHRFSVYFSGTPTKKVTNNFKNYPKATVAKSERVSGQRPEKLNKRKKRLAHSLQINAFKK